MKPPITAIPLASLLLSISTQAFQVSISQFRMKEVYDQALAEIWHPSELSANKTNHDAVAEIIRYASLAPNSHNTQPWKFQVHDSSITVLPDLARACPAVDPDDHHLYISLGCAVENIVIAAKAYGFCATADTSEPQSGIHIDLEPCPSEASDMFDAIPKRQVHRCDFDGKPLHPEELKKLQLAGTGDGARVVLLTDPKQINVVKDFVVRGNTAQFKNKDFTDELKEWIRFSSHEAVQKGDGLYGPCVGNNSPATPHWFGNMIFNLVVSPENDKFARQIESSAGIAVFLSDQDDPVHWVEVGRCYERFALQATALGIKNAFVNQPIEEAEIRPLFQEALALAGARADLVVRFGRTEQEMPKSLRRPVEDVIVQ